MRGSKRRRGDRGAVTAEYALVTVGGIAMAALLWTLATSRELLELMRNILTQIWLSIASLVR